LIVAIIIVAVIKDGIVSPFHEKDREIGESERFALMASV
jgi:hypothetical protein